MIRTTQSSVIEQEILNCIKLGITNKRDIYDKLVEKFNFPRPTIRRVARDLRIDLMEIIKILDPDIPKVEVKND